MTNETIAKNGDGLYVVQDGEVLPVHTAGEQHIRELKAYLHEWQIDDIEVSES